MNEKNETRSEQLQCTSTPTDEERINVMAKNLGVTVSTYLLICARIGLACFEGEELPFYTAWYSDVFAEQKAEL